MILNKSISGKIFKYVNSCKSVSRLGFNQTDFDRWCHTLNCVAKLDYKVSFINDQSLEDYSIPNSFKDLVVPRKIAYAEGLAFGDLRSDAYVKYDPKDAGFEEGIEILNTLEFNSITVGLFTAKRQNNTDNKISNLKDLSGYKALSDVENRLTLGKHVLDNNVPYVPILSKFVLREKSEYVINFDSMFNKWLELAFNNLNKDSNTK